ncbi:hypothetical protein S14_23 [Shewanella sp. phage 1/4]|uniref:hypothetical protein n=1 Tax=Shewanella phage 1/4 TaxID=1458859 RepID=UPI0004F8EA93|nr:hypothetical protein S14_23 [Shewanella sp. phage 1/4]AHK11135.1 hypothetical protein S14_23 [Shewanella sp. phage 1/4]
MNIKDLQTLDEVLKYGSLGEVVISTPEDWFYLDKIVDMELNNKYTLGFDAGQEESSIESEYEFECGYEQGLRQGGVI